MSRLGPLLFRRLQAALAPALLSRPITGLSLAYTETLSRLAAGALLAAGAAGAAAALSCCCCCCCTEEEREEERIL